MSLHARAAMKGAVAGIGATNLATQAVWYGLAGAFGKAAALLAVPYLTRHLGPEGYGLADLATSLAALMVVVLRFGADIPTMRLAAREPGERAQVYAAYIAGTAILGIAGAVALLPVAGLISAGLWSSPEAVPVAIAALVLVPVSAVQFALINILRFAERPRTYAALAAVDLFAQLGFAVAFVALGMGSLGVIVGYVVGSTVGLVAALAAGAPLLDPRLNLRVARRIFAEGLPFVPGAAAFLTADGISRMLAANYLDVAAVGQLALAIRIAGVLSLASLAFQTAWGPYGLSLMPGSITRTIFGRVTIGITATISLVAVAIGALAPEIAVWIAGDEFADAALVVPGLLVSAGMPAVLYVFATAAGILRRGPWVAVSSLIGATIQIGSVALLLPHMGITGFAAGAILGRVASLLILSLGVSEAVQLPRSAVAIILGGTGVSMWMQVLFNDPTGTWPLRALIGAVALIIGGLVLGSWVRRLRLRTLDSSP